MRSFKAGTAIVSVGGWRAWAAGPIAALLETGASAQSQVTAPDGASPQAAVTVSEIVVTANKRAETSSTVPMSITAESGETLRRQGIEDVRDLEKITPGFVYADSYV